MQLLDAAIALALTLAALATVVTVIMEIVLRGVRMRKRNLVALMRMVNAELPQGALGLDEQERWEFFKKVVENPAQGIAEHVPKMLEEGETADAAIGRMAGRSLRGGIYDKVSTEHVLRRLSELPKVRRMSTQAADRLEKELYRLASKYEEFGSAVSASFKRRSQFWSIVVGVALALVVNVDGVRVFEAYVVRPELAQAVMASGPQPREAGGDVEGSGAEAAGQGGDANAGADPEELRDLAADVQRRVADLVALGVPVGNAYFPHCRLFGGETPAATCAGPRWPPGVAPELWSERGRFLGHLLLWLVPVTITGMLIGLGAPFWFDVAKRLAEVRSMFRGTASDETRLAARDAGGDPEKRDAIVSRVVKDAAASTARAAP